MPSDYVPLLFQYAGKALLHGSIVVYDGVVLHALIHPRICFHVSLCIRNTLTTSQEFRIKNFHFFHSTFPKFHSTRNPISVTTSQSSVSKSCEKQISSRHRLNFHLSENSCSVVIVQGVLDSTLGRL